MMKKLITAAIAASALTVAVPAMAQSYSYLSSRTSDLDQRIDTGVADGSLTSGEASVLRARLHDVERLQDRYQDDGMTGWQQRALDRRYDDLSAQLYSMRHNTEYRYRRWHDDDVW